MATLVPVAINAVGLLNPASVAAAAGGDDIKPDEGVFVRFRNGDTTPTTITLVVPGAEYNQNRPDVAVTVPASGEVFFGPFGRDLADPVTKRVGFTYSKVIALTVTALRI